MAPRRIACLFEDLLQRSHPPVLHRRGPDDLVGDAMAGYFDELARTRQMLDLTGRHLTFISVREYLIAYALEEMPISCPRLTLLLFS